MSVKTKSILFYFTFGFIACAIIYLILLIIFDGIETIIRIGVTALITSVLLPQRNSVQKQLGREIQLKWFFSKKIITLR